MSTWLIVLIIITVILLALTVGLYFFGKKQEKKQAEQQEQMKSMSQQLSILVIDKKRMKLKDAGFPAVVLENTPVVKAKAGPKIMTFMCDEKVFPLIPIKKEVKAIVSGIYITDVKGIRGALDTKPAKKKGLFKRFKK